MTQEELARRLTDTGLPVAYRAFRTRQDPPYICYVYVYDAQFFADDVMYSSPATTRWSCTPPPRTRPLRPR